jgi:hypothetical protein
MKIPNAWRWLIFVLPAAVVFGGCGDQTSAKSMFDRALSRMANVAEVDSPPRQPLPPLPDYPRPRDLRLPEADLRVGFGTYLSLGQCHLLGEISARNSSLGRVQAASTRLLYELRFYRQLKHCLRELEQSPERDADFHTRLKAIEISKRSNLPSVFWNATFASPEFRTLLNTAADPLARGQLLPTADIVGALGLLSRIGRTLETDMATLELAELEPHYYALQAGKVVGPLLRGMVESRDYLVRGTGLLEAVARENRLCPGGHKTQRGEYLFNVFRKFYIGEVQPYLSLLHRTARPLIEGLDELLHAQGVEPPPAFVEFYAATLNPAATGSLWQTFNEDIARHTRAWQTVLKQCDLMPTGPDH